jgi:hypothetical protein
MAASPTAKRTSYSDVLPLQPPCPHAQSMSGVFSIASHSVLQYLPDVATHEQTGCAHSPAFAVVISFCLFAIGIAFLPVPDQQRMIQEGIIDTSKRRFCPKKNTYKLCC